MIPVVGEHLTIIAVWVFFALVNGAGMQGMSASTQEECLQDRELVSKMETVMHMTDCIRIELVPVKKD